MTTRELRQCVLKWTWPTLKYGKEGETPSTLQLTKKAVVAKSFNVAGSSSTKVS